MPEPDWNTLFAQIKQRYQELNRNTDRQVRFLMHVENLGGWEIETPDHASLDSLDPDVNFPEETDVAYAMCHPDCGVREFIVEGSTQECQRCGRNMYRIESRKYTKQR